MSARRAGAGAPAAGVRPLSLNRQNGRRNEQASPHQKRRARTRARACDWVWSRLCTQPTSTEKRVGTPQTPDSMQKSREEKAPPPKRENAHPGKLSNPDKGAKPEKRQGPI